MKTLTVTRDARGVARVTRARPEVFDAWHDARVAELDTDEAREGLAVFGEKRPARGMKAVRA